MAPVTRNLTLDTLMLRRESNRKHADTERQKLQLLLDAEDSSHLARIRASVKQCERYVDTLQELDSDIARAIEDDADQKYDMATDVASATDYEVRLSAVISAAEVRIDEIVEQSHQPVVDQDDTNSNSSGNPGKRFKNLPKLTIAAFDGSPLKWQEFWDAFDSAINSNSDLNAVDKFQYLKEFLKGNALLLTEGYRMTKENYETVVDMLKQRFGDKEVAIQAHFDALMSLKPATGEISQIQRVFDECEVHIRSLVALDLDEATFGRVFAPIMKSKLPEHIRLELERRHDGTPWTLSGLRELLRNELHARRMSKQVIGQSAPKPPTGDAFKPWSKPKFYQGYKKPDSRPPASASSFIASDGKRSGPVQPCAFCNQVGHYSEDCRKYPDLESRRKVLKGCCFLCLRRGHRQRDCEAGDKVCFHCKATGKHNRSLCPAKFGKDTKDSALNVDAVEFVPQAYSMVGTTVATRGRRGLAVMQTALATVKGARGKEQVRLLFDPASTRSFGRTDVLRRIGAKQVKTEILAVAGLGSEKRSTAQYGVAELDLILQDGSEFPLTVNSVRSISCPIQKHALDADKYPVLKKVELADPPPDRPEMVQIDLLIGLDVYYSLVGWELCRTDTFVILETKVGYVASGCVPTDAVRTDDIVPDTVMFSTQSSDEELHAMVERLWTLESLGISDTPQLTDDQLAQEFFDKTVRFDKASSRYEVRWPFKPDHTDLPTNYGLAYGRLVSFMKRLTREPEILTKYHEIILDQEAKGVVEDAPVVPDGELVHYLPHHCVIKPHKVTTKIRVVYDASAKVSKNVLSLNERLYRGPVYLADLPGLIMRFRRNEIGLISDIEKAFWQVSLQVPERDVTRFLWLKDPTKGVTRRNLRVMRFRRVIFGFTCSPFLLAATIRHHLAKMASPVAKDILANNYVDNIITGCSTITEAMQYYQEAKKVFNSVSMNLREWYSNSEEFMRQIAEKDRGLATNVVMVLGLPWDLKADTLGCTSKASKDLVGVPATKRSILRIAASVYDPCGYITPITVQAKLLLQSLWRRGCDWDEKIPEDLQKNWDGCLLNLCKVKEIRFDRFQGSLTDSVCELHIFCDAAKPAYGAVAYLRVETGTQVRCDLVFAKSRVSPAKNQTLTIPKLELTAMVVGCRMAKFLQTQFDVSETYIWGDSQCALHWAMGGESSMTYVQHRVKQIKEMGEWTLRHVPGEHNPADLLTRNGITAEKLKDCRFWWSGPAWLTQDAATWPPIPTALNHEEEPSLEPEEIVMVSYVYPSSLLKFSKWSKVLRVTSYTIRFIYNCKARKLGLQRRTGPLSAAEVKHAKERWVKLAQEPLVQALEKKPSPQHVRQLGMFLDSKGFLRCSGQLDYSDLPKSTKYPLALPKDSPINRLLIVDMHHRLMHAGTSHVLAELRQEYWIINARSQVKQVRAKCQVCRRERGGRFRTPQPAPLPDFRACRGECFSRVGLDYLGPVYYRDGKKSVKAWICLFTCALSRAIHLEVIPDMTAEQFLLALRRFMALYGKPDLIVCDNAKTFHSSQLATNQLFREAVHHNSVRGYTSSRGIDWKFVVEMAPWMGGFYERMVSLVKDRFKCAVQRKRLTYVELQTVCAEMPNYFFIKSGHPMSRYHCFSRKLGYSGPDGPVYLPSVQHAYYFAMFVQSGKPDVATSLANDTATEWDASHVDSSAKSHGLEMTADLLVNSRKFYEDLIMSQLDVDYNQGREDYGQMLRFFQETSMTDPKTDALVVCSRNRETVYSCGYKESEVKEMLETTDRPFFSAAHVWSKIMRKVLDVNLEVMEGVFNFVDKPPLKFMKEPLTFQHSHPKTVLFLSNSIFRYVKSFELGERHILKSATFESLAKFALDEQLRFVDFHFVVLQAGVVECDRGSRAERSSLKALESLLSKVTKDPNCPQILVCPTFPYYGVHRSTQGFGRWMKSRLKGFAPLVTVVDWDSTGNPFFQDRNPVQKLFDDRTHPNRLGNQHLIQILHDYIPELGLIQVDYFQSPYGENEPATKSISASCSDRDVVVLSDSEIQEPPTKKRRMEDRVVVKIRKR